MVAVQEGRIGVGWDGSRYVEDSDQEQRLDVPPSHMQMKATQFLAENDAAL